MANKMNYLLTTTKPWKLAVLISTLGFALMVLYCGLCNNFLPSSGSLFSTRFIASSSIVHDEFYDLRKLLKEASTKEKTVILTYLNEAWAAPNSMFDLFLESFRIGNNTSWLLNHLLVISIDEKAHIRCHMLVSHCYFFKTNESSKMAKDARFMTPIYLEMMWERLAFLQTILSLGYSFVFTDTDIMWFRNPFQHFTLDSDFQISCDRRFTSNEYDVKNNNDPNNGFLFVRSNNRTIEFYKYWVHARRTYPKLHEQNVFIKIKGNSFVREIGVKFRFLNTDYFGGFCSPSKDFNKVCTMHANCCIGLDAKLADLKATLEDWKNYLSSNHITQQHTYWSVPKKCYH